MPKIINYVECDCEKGKLTEFAETSIYTSSDSKGNRFNECSEFWQCDKCLSIFQRDKSKNALDDTSKTVYQEFIKLTFSTTKEEIIDITGQIFGCFLPMHEDLIITLRKIKEATLRKDHTDLSFSVGTSLSDIFPAANSNIGAVKISKFNFAWCLIDSDIKEGDSIIISYNTVSIFGEEYEYYIAIKR
ncbi:hypothetical protein C0583_04460 [Candidatus Parcubacteria bacterium]|nr:MAG: hypothetical protein C0583_04460 [Candidatus Parcubacteria bacterium]